MLIKLIQGKEPSFDNDPKYRNGAEISGKLISLSHLYKFGRFKFSVLQIPCRDGYVALAFRTPLRVPESLLGKEVSFYEFTKRFGPLYRKEYRLINGEDNFHIIDRGLSFRKWYGRDFHSYFEQLQAGIVENQEERKC